MTLQQVRYILEISRYSSISKAAQELYLTQPYLSSMLKELENELHITIFNRTRKGVKLTEEGKNFIQIAKPLLEQEKRIYELYSQKQRELPFHFCVSLQHYSFAVEAFYQFFKKCSPQEFDVHIRECCMEQVICDVFEQRSEIGIIFISDSTDTFIRKYLNSRDLEFNEIANLTPYAFFRKKHPMAARNVISLEEMYDFPFASYESLDNVSIDFSEEALFPNLTMIKRRFYVTDRATMINTLSHTNAFSIGSGILSYGFAGPELTSRPLITNKDTMHIGWIQSANSPISKSGLAFLDNLKDVLKNTSRPTYGNTVYSENSAPKL